MAYELGEKTLTTVAKYHSSKWFQKQKSLSFGLNTVTNKGEI